MLRATLSVLVKSHQLKKAQHPDASSRYGRNYNRSFIKYGFGGFGMSVYSPKKNRSFRVQPQFTHLGSEGAEEHRTLELTTGGLQYHPLCPLSGITLRWTTVVCCLSTRRTNKNNVVDHETHKETRQLA